jgi:hypothetical protein
MRKWVTTEEDAIKSGAFMLDGIGLTPSKITQFEDDAVTKKTTREYYQNLINDYNRTAVAYKKIGMVRVRTEEFPKNTLRKIVRFRIDHSID